MIAASTLELEQRDAELVGWTVRRSAELHMLHISRGGDPFELNEARPLDFGHWAAHKLEHMTRFDLRHGEAVAIGLALDVIYSGLERGLAPAKVQRILDCLSGLGFSLYHPVLRDTETLLGGLDDFREHLGGRLTITLLDDLGVPADVHRIDRSLMRRAVERLHDQWSRHTANQGPRPAGRHPRRIPATSPERVAGEPVHRVD